MESAAGRAMKDSPKISVIIPSLRGEVDELKSDLVNQSVQPDEIIVSKGIIPVSKARNEGVKRSRGYLLVFMDDDIRLGHKHLLSNLTAPFQEDTIENIGVVGVPRILPENSPWFQKRLAKKMPRVVFPVVDKLTETDYDIDTTCCAFKRSLFDELGGFDEQLISGEDSEFFYRVNRLEYQNYIAPNSYVYHPTVGNLSKLVRKYFWYGMGHCQCAHKHPQWGCGIRLRNSAMAVAYLLFRTLIFLPNIFFPFSYRERSLKPGFKPIKSLASYSAAWGYIYSWFKYIRRG